jgi:hypothetical protein
VHGPESAEPSVELVLAAYELSLTRILPSACMCVDCKKWGVLLLQIVEAVEQHGVLEHVGVIANVKGMTVREHARGRS